MSYFKISYFKINAGFEIKGLISAKMYFGIVVFRANSRVNITKDPEKV